MQLVYRQSAGCSASLAQFASLANVLHLWPHWDAAHCSNIYRLLTQNMRLRKTKTVLDDVIPHCPIVDSKI